MLVGVHCEAKFWWVTGSFEGSSGCQRLFSGV